jgi:hypothetical protein
MANVRPIRFYIVRTRQGIVSIHERTDVQMRDWLVANPGSELVGMPSTTRKDAEVALKRLQKSR